MHAGMIRNSPAREWAEGFPLGNGRVGAVIWGEGTKEILSLNHEHLWRRYITQPSYKTYQDMPKIKSLCREGKWQEAEEVLLRTLPATGETLYINPFVPAFDLYISLYRNAADITDYQRILDAEHGIVTTSYVHKGVTYISSSFCDCVGGLLYTHLYAGRPGKLKGEISLSRMPDCECVVTGGADYDGVYCAGEFEEGVRFAAYSAVYHRGGRLTGGKKNYGIDGEEVPPKKLGLRYVFDRDQGVSAARGASLCMDTCDEVWIVTALSVDTLDADPQAACKTAARDAIRSFDDFEARQEAHEKAFFSLFDRTRLYLPENKMLQDMFDMARYVAISSGMSAASSSNGHTPINLQGIWNRDTRPAWESDYHLDLNIQMCYWPLPAMGLADLMEPYLSWLEGLLPQAKKRAADLYGAKGACFAGCCDPWVLGGCDNLSVTFGINAWLADILYLYYEYMPKPELLARIRNVMAEFDAFYRSVVIEEKGMLTFPFGSSPEMSLMIGDHRQWLSSPSAFDLTAVRMFYTDYERLSGIANDVETAAACKAFLEKLAEPVINEAGELQEWTEAHTEGEPGHRHRSPLVAFCPGTLYTKESHPEITAAMEKLLERRLSYGNGMSTAFSYAWDAQIFARLGRGDEALSMLEKLQTIHGLDSGMYTTNDYDGKSGGIAWFPGSKVVQVEAQLGSASAIAELFYRDEQNLIRLLPALPKAISKGEMRGIRGRRGVKCDLSWEKGLLKDFRIKIAKAGEYRICIPDGKIRLAEGEAEFSQEGNLIILHADSDSEYHFLND